MAQMWVQVIWTASNNLQQVKEAVSDTLEPPEDLTAFWKIAQDTTLTLQN